MGIECNIELQGGMESKGIVATCGDR